MPHRLLTLVVLLLCAGSRSLDAFRVRNVQRRGLHVRAATPSSTEPVLAIDDIAARWSCTKYGQDGYNVVDVADRDYCFTTHQITMKRTGGLGLELLEYDAAEKGNMGLVLVGGVVPGSNAAACGGFVVGDTLVEISASLPGGGEAMTSRLEGLNFDSTVNELSRYSDYDTVMLIVKRMARRGEVTVVMVGPQGEDAGSFKVLTFASCVCVSVYVWVCNPGETL